MIVNSSIQAGGSILCRRIGNLSGGSCRFSIGYPPQYSRVMGADHVGIGAGAGNHKKTVGVHHDFTKKSSHISDEEKSVLDQLLEQRELYLKKTETLKAKLNTVNQVLDKKSSEKIQCEKLYPVLDVRIGKLTEKITTGAEACNIHSASNSIYLT